MVSYAVNVEWKEKKMNVRNICLPTIFLMQVCEDA